MPRRPDLVPLAVAERRSLLELLTALTPEQWAAPSLCSGWTVRDVAVHVVSYDALSWSGLAATLVRGGLRPDAANEVLLRRHASLGPEEVVELVERHLRPRGLTAQLGGGIALTDGTIHHQDIRRALGLPRTIAADQLRPVLDFALRAPTIPARGHAAGLRLVATDLAWQHGRGPEVTGPGEALLMAVAGRAHPLDELEGPGLATLATRVAG